jgi:hypothetical protein
MSSTTPSADRPRIGPAAIVLLLLMAAGSILLWLVAPIGWIWVAAQTATPARPTLGPLLIIALALPVSEYLIVLVLRRLDRMFSAATGLTPDNRRMAVPWMKGMTEEGRRHRRTTALDIVMLISVSAAAVVAGVLWLFFPHIIG